MEKMRRRRGRRRRRNLEKKSTPAGEQHADDQGACMFNYQKCIKRRNFNLKDRISGLPDELVISILSFLTIKEAARTSILSSRWIDLWKYMTGSLNFDAPPKEVFMQAESPELVELRTKYVNWINQVLCLHKGTCISEFRVWFDMDLSFKSQIDNWINFAIQKKVRRLELHLMRMNYYDPKKGRFPFPSLSLVSSRPTTLIELRLIGVDVTGEVLECFLSNCPNLEEICVEDSPALVTLKISGPSLKLNNLEIVNCHYMKLLEISAVNLVSFKYHGPELSHLFMSVPRLTEGSFAGEICECHQLLSFVSQLEKLVLVLRSSYYPVFFRFPNFPTLRNLKQLELEVFVSDDVSALRYIPLIKASPSLYSFSLQFSWEFPSMQRLFLAKIKKHALKSLRLIQLAGFAGRTTDVEFAQYMLENVVSLEKITIDTRRRDYEEVSDEMIAAAKKCAEELRTKLPPGGAEMVII